MSGLIVAHGGGLADGALLVLFPLLSATAGHVGEEDAGTLEQQ